MNELKINYLAVLACVVFLHALGFVWYGPLFGEPWMAMVGLDMAALEANPPGAGVWITNLISSVASVYMLAWVLAKMNVTSGVRGAVMGFLLSFTFHHLTEMNGNGFAMMPYRLAWITGGFSLVGMAVSGFILGAWPKKAG
ncbi:MAG: DUF1761 domain-containing protein [Cytophagales bacterium]|nr:DUF1761 domain-containing protein [Cytophagales bacterium]